MSEAASDPDGLTGQPQLSFSGARRENLQPLHGQSTLSPIVHSMLMLAAIAKSPQLGQTGPDKAPARGRNVTAIPAETRPTHSHCPVIEKNVLAPSRLKHAPGRRKSIRLAHSDFRSDIGNFVRIGQRHSGNDGRCRRMDEIHLSRRW